MLNEIVHLLPTVLCLCCWCYNSVGIAHVTSRLLILWQLLNLEKIYRNLRGGKPGGLMTPGWWVDRNSTGAPKMVLKVHCKGCDVQLAPVDRQVKLHLCSTLSGWTYSTLAHRMWEWRRYYSSLLQQRHFLFLGGRERGNSVERKCNVTVP